MVISKSGVSVAALKPKRELGFAAGAFSMSDLTEFNTHLDPETQTRFNSTAAFGDFPGLTTLWAE